jgi:t-SNARE complex subunit (syntaxin)
MDLKKFFEKSYPDNTIRLKELDEFKELELKELEELEEFKLLEELIQLEEDTQDINNIYKDINENIQGQVIDTIEENMDNTKTHIEDSSNKLTDASIYYTSYKYYQYALYGITIIGTALLLL